MLVKEITGSGGSCCSWFSCCCSSFVMKFGCLVRTEEGKLFIKSFMFVVLCVVLCCVVCCFCVWNNVSLGIMNPFGPASPTKKRECLDKNGLPRSVKGLPRCHGEGACYNKGEFGRWLVGPHSVVVSPQAKVLQNVRMLWGT